MLVSIHLDIHIHTCIHLDIHIQTHIHLYLHVDLGMQIHIHLPQTAYTHTFATKGKLVRGGVLCKRQESCANDSARRHPRSPEVTRVLQPTIATSETLFNSV